MNVEKEIGYLKKEIDSVKGRILKLEQIITEKGGKQKVDEKRISAREFLLSKKPKDGVQKTLTIGYYLEHYKGFSLFNKRDLEKGFKSAKEKTPPNINDKVNLNIRNGHMVEVEERKDSFKAWILTDSGEKYVESGFSED